MKKGQIVRIAHEEFALHLDTMEQLFGSGNKPELQGELLAVNPTAEEFATFDDNFRTSVEYGDATTESLKGSVVYYDEGAGRAFHVGEDMVEVVEDETDEFDSLLNDEEEKPDAPEVQYGDIVEAQGMGALFTSLVGGSGRGRVVHVGKPNYEFQNDQVLEEHLAGKSEQVHLTEGVMYLDEEINEIMWLAEGDFTVVG